jgi:hypothetical protein
MVVSLQNYLTHFGIVCAIEDELQQYGKVKRDQNRTTKSNNS